MKASKRALCILIEKFAVEPQVCVRVCAEGVGGEFGGAGTNFKCLSDLSVGEASFT